ncbi:MAG: cupin domain-containing protein [Candidatus Thioglobus sp.]|uniref:cupin domain-containing protein n=1 Tax=Candidatus Thioglobus sp. TaxID=2026721 RepID=UPI002639329E|nr:cupin domain-containing protein [Candidatus Thioglobus sp.]MDC9726493.1 cupin domain-containing protein [Candidatus Thioglobus sp.]
MIHFGKISEEEFLADYWQKKPLLIKQALPDFISPLSPDELAGLSLEEDFESRLITGSIDHEQWTLTNGPFLVDDFAKLPDNDWTLLVQGVDRFIPEVCHLIDHFNFIPRWRFDDVMISYAAKGGSVGPHFDHYDVFLLQGSGRRRWELSTKNCTLDNYLEDVPLRIMQQFIPEQVFEVEPGDILYIPPKIAHHGVSLDDQCTTLSFGYRSYSVAEMFDDSSVESTTNYYQDPTWANQDTPALIPKSAIQKANEIALIDAINFTKFVTKLDTLDQQILQNFQFNDQDECFNTNLNYELYPVCKIAYLFEDQQLLVFINGEIFDHQVEQVQDLINFCNTRKLLNNQITFTKTLFELGFIQPTSTS